MSGLPKPLRRDGPALAILLGFSAYALAFIWRTSFVPETDPSRHFCLFDDAMVSMRYARNLAEGHGLVWNPGEAPVEGITNLLWTLVMAALHLLPVGAAKVSGLVQLVSAGCLVGVLVLVRRLALDVGGSRASALSAMALTAAHLPFTGWALVGMEVGLLALLLLGALVGWARQLEDGRFRPWPFILLGIATLVRLDAALGVAAGALFLFFADRENRRAVVAWAGGVLLVAVGGQTLWRLAYYGQALPNTYLLKMAGFPVGWRVWTGLWRLGGFFLSFGVLALGAAVLGLRGARRPAWLLAFVFATFAAYSVWVGGDAWEWMGGANRFVSVALPALLVLLAGALDRGAGWLVARLAARAGGRVRMGGGAGGGARIGAWASGERARPVMVAVGTAVLVLAVNPGTPTDTLRALMVLGAPDFVADHARLVDLAAHLREATGEDASVAVAWAGVLPYFAGRRAVDLLGKNDPHVARLTTHRVPAHPGLFFPGHQKWDYAHSLGAKRPDVIVQLWDLSYMRESLWELRVPPDAEPFVTGRYLRTRFGRSPVLLAKGSPRVRWDRVPPADP